jgi:hypothetical protein
MVLRSFGAYFSDEDRRTADYRCRREREDTVAVRADDVLEGDTANPDRHPIAIALRRQDLELQIVITPHSTWPTGRQIAPPKSTTPFQKRTVAQTMIVINSVAARTDANSQ